MTYPIGVPTGSSDRYTYRLPTGTRGSQATPSQATTYLVTFRLSVPLTNVREKTERKPQ